ncbi:hypothetical protein HO913_03760 [Streptococcus suis]|nr:hypothetical protein [Streptococcus suis]
MLKGIQSIGNLALFFLKIFILLVCWDAFDISLSNPSKLTNFIVVGIVVLLFGSSKMNNLRQSTFYKEIYLKLFAMVAVVLFLFIPTVYSLFRVESLLQENGFFRVIGGFILAIAMLIFAGILIVLPFWLIYRVAIFIAGTDRSGYMQVPKFFKHQPKKIRLFILNKTPRFDRLAIVCGIFLSIVYLQAGSVPLPAFLSFLKVGTYIHPLVLVFLYKMISIRFNYSIHNFSYHLFDPASPVFPRLKPGFYEELFKVKSSGGSAVQQKWEEDRRYNAAIKYHSATVVPVQLPFITLSLYWTMDEEGKNWKIYKPVQYLTGPGSGKVKTEAERRATSLKPLTEPSIIKPVAKQPDIRRK